MISQDREREPREFPRYPAMIPVRLEVLHAWEGTAFSVLSGSLFNLSRGGAGLRLMRVLPPRTKIVIFVPAGPEGLRLRGIIVWTSVVPGLGHEPVSYGVRWFESLSRPVLDMLSPFCGASA